MFGFIEQIVYWALNLVSTIGYGGLFLTMSLESAGIPIPSEVIVPFGGYLASTGRFNLGWVVATVTLANLAGSIIFYIIGYYGGTAFLDKYGCFLLIHKKERERMDRWLQRHGRNVAFFSRLIPGVRTFSSLAIGAGEVKFPVFSLYTLLGSAAWNSLWACAGYYAGRRWNIFEPYVRKIEYVIIVVVAVLASLYVYKHIKRWRKGIKEKA